MFQVIESIDFSIPVSDLSKGPFKTCSQFKLLVYEHYLFQIIKRKCLMDCIYVAHF